MTLRLLLLLSAFLLLCPSTPARALVTSAGSTAKSAAAPAAGPVFSVGSISIAPTPQWFAAPPAKASAVRKPQTGRPARPSSRFVQPVPFRTYNRI